MMEECFQFENMNMIDHGNMVHEFYSDLIGQKSKEWDFGKVGDLIEQVIKLSASLEKVKDYHVYHDCVKPVCRTVDEHGKQHFPNHAQVSYETWLSHGGDEETAWYILHDMDFHIMKPNDMENLYSDPRMPTLLLTAWSEIHANSQMFGGIDSTSFKIKRKHLEKHTKMLVNKLPVTN